MGSHRHIASQQHRAVQLLSYDGNFMSEDWTYLHEPASEVGSKTNGPCVGDVLLKHVVRPHGRDSRKKGPCQPSKGLQQCVVSAVKDKTNKGKIKDISPATVNTKTQYSALYRRY